MFRSSGSKTQRNVERRATHAERRDAIHPRHGPTLSRDNLSRVESRRRNRTRLSYSQHRDSVYLFYKQRCLLLMTKVPHPPRGMHSSLSERRRVSVVAVLETRTSHLLFAPGMAVGLDSGQSTETVSEGRGSVEITDVVLPYHQAPRDAASSKAATLQAHMLPFPLTPDGFSDVRRGLSSPTRRQDGI